MNKKMKTILSLAGFAVFIALAVFAYDRLGKEVRPNSALNVIGEGATASTDEPQASPDMAAQLTEEDTAAPQPTETDLPRQAAAAETAEPEKQKAPDFTVQDMDGKEVKLSDFIGRPVVVNFWASWCPPCKYEMPEFEEVFQELGGDVAFMMVDLVDGQRETKEKGVQYIADEGYTFPVYFDVDQQTAITYGVMSIPTTYFIDAEGYLIAGAQSAIDAETLKMGIGMIR